MAINVLITVMSANDSTMRSIDEGSIFVLPAADAAAFELTNNAKIGGAFPVINGNSTINSLPDAIACLDG